MKEIIGKDKCKTESNVFNSSYLLPLNLILINSTGESKLKIYNKSRWIIVHVLCGYKLF